MLILLIVTGVMAVYAVEWDGTSTGTGGAGGVPATGGYSVYKSEVVADMLVGYRFSISKVSN